MQFHSGLGVYEQFIQWGCCSCGQRGACISSCAECCFGSLLTCHLLSMLLQDFVSILLWIPSFSQVHHHQLLAWRRQCLFLPRQLQRDMDCSCRDLFYREHGRSSSSSWEQH